VKPFGRLGGALAVAIAGALAVMAVPARASAQVIAACDFDVADDLGAFMEGGVMKLVGRAGRTSTLGNFYIINSNTPESDFDKDGYSPSGCQFNGIYVARRIALRNVANEALAIGPENLIVINLPSRLRPGEQAIVGLQVQIPEGTVAGRYIGFIEIRDSLRGPAITPTGDFWNLDRIAVEVEVLPEAGLTVLDPETDTEIDSVVVRGRAGTRASAAFRIANAGNTGLEDVRLSATDLRSESAVGLVIPASAVTFAAPSFAGIPVGDTARVTVTVAIPRGILGGRYRGSIIVQSASGLPGQSTGGTQDRRTSREIPLIVIVTSSRGILFANNPVRSALGDVAQIAFNGDPGTAYQLGIFDMMGLMVFKTSGSVFSGAGGTATTPGVGADFAVNFAWPLVNGRGEAVASGMYLVVVESIVNGQRVIARDRLMVIR
jgi:hypothetical protein